MNKPVSLEDYQLLLISLLEKQKVFMLATLNQQHMPEASMTPFVFYQQVFWVFVSQLSSHTDNLAKRPDLSVLINENINNTLNPFMVQRASIACRATHAAPEEIDKVLAVMSDRLGETVSLLRQLPDFHLFKLEPKQGRFIAGFGKAFDIDFASMTLQHVDVS